MFGGAQIGDTDYWIGDYTVEAENGGLGVFAHEFAHDLGLPDFYDTNAGENGTAFWTLMSSGSWMDHGTEDIGTKPTTWARGRSSSSAGSTTPSSSEGRAARTLNPSRSQVRQAGRHRRRPGRGRRDRLHDRLLGHHAWWTSSADDLNTTLTRTRRPLRRQERDLDRQDLVRHRGRLRLPVPRVLDRRRRHWTQIGAPLDGSSNGTWKALRYTMPGGGADTLFRFRYQTDGGVHLPGAFIDDITVKNGGTTLFSDDVEGGDNGWTADGGLQDQHRHRIDRRSLLHRREPHLCRL